jgi:putative ABC transport system ATP-binding protein
MNHNKLEPAIQLIGVSKTYQQGGVTLCALDHITLTIPARKFIAIMGASGSGKSTLMHIIGGLTTPTEGEVRIFGKTISGDDKSLTVFRRRSIGFVFQAFNLLPTMSALENVCLPLVIDGARLADVRSEGEKLLKNFGLEDRLYHRPDQLSGGQQQRVAIARSLMNKAPLLLADEPTGNLDSKTGEMVLHMLRKLVTTGNRTLVMVTHDPKAAAYADHVITLSDGQIVEQLVNMPHSGT